MGLGFIDPLGRTLHFGPYSSVDRARSIVLKAASRHMIKQKFLLQDDGSHSSATIAKYNHCVDFLDRACQPSQATFASIWGKTITIDYSYTRKHLPHAPPEALVNEHLSGVIWFTNFSDSEGCYSVGMVRDIALMFEKLWGILETELTGGLDDSFLEKLAEIKSFFQEAASRDLFVQLC